MIGWSFLFSTRTLKYVTGDASSLRVPMNSTPPSYLAWTNWTFTKWPPVMTRRVAKQPHGMVTSMNMSGIHQTLQSRLREGGTDRDSATFIVYGSHLPLSCLPMPRTRATNNARHNAVALSGRMREILSLSREFMRLIPNLGRVDNSGRTTGQGRGGRVPSAEYRVLSTEY